VGSQVVVGKRLRAPEFRQIRASNSVAFDECISLHTSIYAI
jgi:hypothetical protein